MIEEFLLKSVTVESLGFRLTENVNLIRDHFGSLT